MNIQIKRVYEEYAVSDGFRVLVDRLWPRGVAKAGAKIDLWDKEIAPSNELRRWFNHAPEKWPEFKKLYYGELRENPDNVNRFQQELAGKAKVTLLYGAKDQEHNQAVALKEFLSKPIG